MGATREFAHKPKIIFNIRDAGTTAFLLVTVQFVTRFSLRLCTFFRKLQKLETQQHQVLQGDECIGLLYSLILSCLGSWWVCLSKSCSTEEKVAEGREISLLEQQLSKVRKRKRRAKKHSGQL